MRSTKFIPGIYRERDPIIANICNGNLYNIVFCRSLISQKPLYKAKYSSNPLEMPNFEMPDFEMPDFEMPDFEMPDFEMPDFEILDFNWPVFEILDLDIELPEDN